MSSVKTIIVTNGGSGYTSDPTVEITGGGGSGASAVAVRNGTVIHSIVVLNGGSNFTSKPLIAFSGGGGGSGATAVASLFSEVTPYDICDIEEVKLMLNWQQTDTTKDEHLQNLISYVSGAIEHFINNKVREQEVTEIFTGGGNNLIYPTFFPITSVSKLQYIDAHKELIEEADWHDYVKPYVLYREMFNDMYIARGVLMTEDLLTFLIMGSRIVYKAGYTVDEVPRDIKQVFMEMLQRKLSESKHGDNQLGLQSKTKGGQVVDTQSFIALEPRWFDILSHYKIEQKAFQLQIYR